MSNANGGPARRDGIVPIPQLTYVKVEDHHQDDLVLVKRWKMVPGVVKREPNDASPDDASQQVRGLGGPAQAPPVQVGVKQEPVQAPAAEEQPAVHVPVHNEQALAAAVQAPAPGGPVRRNRVPAVRRNPMRRVRLGPRPEREKKPPQFLADYVRPDNKGGYEAY